MGNKEEREERIWTAEIKKKILDRLVENSGKNQTKQRLKRGINKVVILYSSNERGQSQ